VVKVGPDTSVGANRDFNSQTPAPARLAGNPAERTVTREDAVLDVLPPGLHSTGGSVFRIYASRIVIESRIGTDRIRVKRLEALPVSGDLTSERGTSPRSRNGGCTNSSHEQ